MDANTAENGQGSDYSPVPIKPSVTGAGLTPETLATIAAQARFNEERSEGAIRGALSLWKCAQAVIDQEKRMETALAELEQDLAAAPSVFPASLDEFLKHVVGGDDVADREKRYRDYLKHLLRVRYCEGLVGVKDAYAPGVLDSLSVLIGIDARDYCYGDPVRDDMARSRDKQLAFVLMPKAKKVFENWWRHATDQEPDLLQVGNEFAKRKATPLSFGDWLRETWMFKSWWQNVHIKTCRSASGSAGGRAGAKKKARRRKKSTKAP